MNTAVSGILSSFKEEDIHEFRVEFKKIRAFLRLVQSGLKQGKKIRISGRLKKFYKNIGCIRVIQLQRKKIIKASNNMEGIRPEEYFSMLELEKTIYQKAAKKIMKHKKKLNKEMHSIITALPAEVKRKSISNFTEMKLSAVQKITQQGSIPEESLHEIRKTMKDLMYNQRFIQKYSHGEEFLLAKNQDITNITMLLGDFHDTCVAINQLESDCTKLISTSSEKYLLSKLKDKWQHEKETIKESCLYALQKNSVPVFNTTNKKGPDRNPVPLLIQYPKKNQHKVCEDEKGSNDPVQPFY